MVAPDTASSTAAPETQARIITLAKEAKRLNDSPDFEAFTTRGGVMEGEPLTPERVAEISKWPSREEQLSILVGQILAPGSNLVGAMLGPGGALALFLVVAWAVCACLFDQTLDMMGRYMTEVVFLRAEEIELEGHVTVPAALAAKDDRDLHLGSRGQSPRHPAGVYAEDLELAFVKLSLALQAKHGLGRS